MYKNPSLSSTMTNAQQFTKVANPQIQRSTFDRSSGYKTTLNAGTLYPVFIDEALPGDTFDLKASMFGRLATPIKPAMDNIQFDMHFFSVPNRLVWENWERFNGEQDNPDDTTDYLIPTLSSDSSDGFAEESIYDYLGIPTKVPDLEISALPLRAINLIWNDWYRDENLQDSVTVPRGDGPDTATDYTLLKRNKRKDYFTSALPFAQKSTPVSIPLGESAPVQTSASLTLSGVQEPIKFALTDGNMPSASRPLNVLSTTGEGYYGGAAVSSEGQVYPANLEVDLTAATAATINQLREAFQIQKLFEKDARGGTRYVEIIKAHFGVTSPDGRLQRPELLGGATSRVNMTPVAQTSDSVVDRTPQGNLTAIGTFSSNGQGFVKSFTEHEIIIGLVSVRADLNYQQGLHRMWSRKSRFDFYWPSFAHLGEQAILNKELYAQGSANAAEDEEVFGYSERYAEYRFKPSQITGKFRSNATESLDVWHLAQEFDAKPSLNSGFIEENPPIERIIAVTDEPEFLLDCYFNLKCSRPMPTYATPGFIDQF